MENLHPRTVWENEDTRTPWRKWISYAKLELSYCLPAQVISMMSNTANSFCPPPLAVRFVSWVSPETTARSLVLPTAGTASINKWTRLFSGIAIQFALLHLVKKWPNLKMAMQTKAYCTTTRLHVSWDKSSSLSTAFSRKSTNVRNWLVHSTTALVFLFFTRIACNLL